VALEDLLVGMSTKKRNKLGCNQRRSIYIHYSKSWGLLAAIAAHSHDGRADLHLFARGPAPGGLGIGNRSWGCFTPPSTMGCIAHLAETPFGFCTSAFLPIPPQTPKHLGFGVFMPSELRRDTLFGLKMPASWRNKKKTKNFCTSDFRFNGFFIFL
jgi:hypothetical protein